MNECIFCRIASDEVPADKVYEDEHIVAFRDIQPQAPVHLLIIPKKHISTIDEVHDDDAELIARMIMAGNNLAASEGIAQAGFRYVINCREYGGQAVNHVHLHLLGGRKLAWPPG